MRPRLAYIQDDDPEYDPLGEALTRASIPKNTYKAAADRVYTDGFYGPISKADWLEQDGREPATVSEALAILRKVAEEFQDYNREELYYCDFSLDCAESYGCEPDACEGHSVSVEKIPAKTLVDEVMWFVPEIYGTSILSLSVKEQG